ncbi:hypothetical protein [Actinoplanes auranticolor]|uniref:DUF4352 domain-containing protein n=1 Tax=Actinoplanes auranticolor TaxID=47988 RepID=A0A919SPX8_9ACTN|nr:hypothetical protein [Actinoplanes auranticolor]GIM75516.1 hypothetical protein Aau02nite_66320 [Actinoplanes auranticolor]
MTKEPPAEPAPAEMAPVEQPPPPADDTVPAQMKPVVIGRPRKRGALSRRLVTAYFAVGVVLLLAGTAAVVYLAAGIYDRAATEINAASPVPRASGRVTAPGLIEPSGPLLERIGPQRLGAGEKFVVEGERGVKFEVTVRAGKFRKTGCDAYARKPENGGYLPTELRVKVLAGEPDVTDYAFRFQQRDGTWLNSAYGSNCEKNYGAFVRRLVAGRTYKTTIVFDVPNTKGDIVFVWPTIDVIATWQVR